MRHIDTLINTERHTGTHVETYRCTQYIRIHIDTYIQKIDTRTYTEIQINIVRNTQPRYMAFTNVKLLLLIRQ